MKPVEKEEIMQNDIDIAEKLTYEMSKLPSYWNQSFDLQRS